MNQLAETMVSGEWITGLVVAVIGALGAAWARTKGKEQGRSETAVSLSEPVPTVPTRKVFSPPTWDQHRDLKERVERLEKVTMEIRKDLALQYRELLDAGAVRESRIIDKLDGLATSIHIRIDQQLKACAERLCK